MIITRKNFSWISYRLPSPHINTGKMSTYSTLCTSNSSKVFHSDDNSNVTLVSLGLHFLSFSHENRRYIWRIVDSPMYLLGIIFLRDFWNFINYWQFYEIYELFLEPNLNNNFNSCRQTKVRINIGCRK